MNFVLNSSFFSRRYYWGQLRPIFKECGLKEISVVGVVFTPLTLWRRPVLPFLLSCQVSARLGELSRIPGFRWLTTLSDRCVVCLVKRDVGK
jgi:hypothetical protein